MLKTLLVDVGTGSGINVRGDRFDDVILIEPQKRLASALRRKFGDDARYSVYECVLVPVEVENPMLKLARPSKWTSLYKDLDIAKFYAGFRIVDIYQVKQVCAAKLLEPFKDRKIAIQLDCCGNECALITALLEGVPDGSTIESIAATLSRDHLYFENSASRSSLVSLMESRYFDLDDQQSTGDRQVLRFVFNELRLYQDKLEQADLESRQLGEELRSNRNELESLRAELLEKSLLLEDRQEIRTELDNLNKHISAEIRVVTESSVEQIQTESDNLNKHIWREARLVAESSVKQIQAYMGIRDFFDSGNLGFEFHGWPISSQTAHYLLTLIMQNDYDCILEFGSGTSTLLFIQAIQKKAELRLKQGNSNATPPDPADKPKKVISLEHDLRYFKKTLELLESRQVSDLVELVYAPLIDLDVNGATFPYYSCEENLAILASQLPARDAKLLVLVDGPPQQTGPHARYPAMPLLLQHLSGQKLDVLIDDFGRPAEREMLKSWEELLANKSINYSGEEFEAEKGGYLLRVNQ